MFVKIFQKHGRKYFDEIASKAIEQACLLSGCSVTDVVLVPKLSPLAPTDEQNPNGIPGELSSTLSQSETGSYLGFADKSMYALDIDERGLSDAGQQTTVSPFQEYPIASPVPSAAMFQGMELREIIYWDRL